MAKKYIVRLTEEERADLESLIHKGKVAAHKRLHAEILLKADISELGEKEAHLLALACGDAPDGRSRWTLRLLGQHMVELGHVESVSHETIRQTLKKTN